MKPPKAIFKHLKYVPSTGLFWWTQPGLARQLHKPAGTSRSGYNQICFRYHVYYGHRLAWLFQTGKYPRAEIDHKDGNPSNNKWRNLREATRTQNCQNARRQTNNTSGYKGVCWATKEKRWMASIKTNGRPRFLGYFSTPKKAHAAYRRAAKKYFGEYARF